VFVRVCVYVYMRVCVCMCLFACMCAWVRMPVCMYVACVNVSAHVNTVYALVRADAHQVSRKKFCFSFSMKK